jgi:endoglucanase
MKNLALILIIFTLSSCSVNPVKQITNEDKFVVDLGTNVAHWLSQSKNRGIDRAEFFTEKDVEVIASLGFDHIRLPVDEEQLWDEQGNRYEDAFLLMTNCIDWCLKNNLRVIVDLHILRSHHFNAAEKPLWTDPAEQEKFYDMWRDLSLALKDYPNSMVAYELMNEAVADDPELWNQLVANAVSAIRETEPLRTIVIGSNRWQSYQTFDVLKIPENDPNILLSFHFYEPFLLTHIAASWTNLRGFRGPVHYPGVILTEEEFALLPDDVKPQLKSWVGREFNKQVIAEMFQKPWQEAQELGLPLYCGEYGIVADAPAADRLRWYADMMELFREMGIGSGNWNYKSNNFGLFNNDGTANQELINIITGKK